MGNTVPFKRRPKARSRSRRPKQRSTAVRWLQLVGYASFGIAVYVFVEHAPMSNLGTASQARVETVHEGDHIPLCNQTNRYRCVVDGDTIRYDCARIRLEDIDAPETWKPDCAAEKARGQRATRRLQQLMNAGPFEIVYTGGRDEDVYGRKLRVLERDGESLGGMLIAEGLARPWDGARWSWCD